MNTVDDGVYLVQLDSCSVSGWGCKEVKEELEEESAWESNVWLVEFRIH
jgi:hypothetical protein